MSVLLISSYQYSPEVIDAKAVISSLGAKKIKYCNINTISEKSLEQLFQSDYVVMLSDNMSSEKIEQYLELLKRYKNKKEVLVSKCDPSCLFGNFCKLLGTEICPFNKKT